MINLVVQPDMKLKSLIAYVAAALVLASCSTPKNIVYFQDMNPGSEIPFKNTAQIKIQSKDKLSIIVSTSDERLTDQFNLSMGSTSTQAMGGQTLGYTVDSYGDIIFPVLGEIHVAGLTREQVANLIREELIKRQLVKDPVVIVSFLNLSVAVLGSVGHPGLVPLTKDKVSILDVIAEAGDLTIDGQRENVMIIRNEGGTEKVYYVNLTDANSVYSSPVYYMQQDDVIYVSPNEKAQRNSTVNGNTLQTYSFWMSLTTFVISLGLLFYNLK